MADSSVFQYEPLDYARNQMRLMRANLSQDFAFEIATFDHETAPKYFAVSYTWGTSVDHKRITLNGSSFVVYPNLYQLLSLLHRRREERWFWADQICIDQTSIPDKSNQVAMMREIYGRAEEVVVWLSACGNSLQIPELLLELQGKTLQRLGEKRNSDPDTKNTTLHRKELATFGETMDRSPLVFQQFYENPYWYRLWIIQELLIAREISLVCESGYCSWLLLEQVGKQLVAKHKSSLSPLKIFLRAVSHDMMVIDEVFGRGPHNFVRGKCQDPRDKVFALRGLFPGIPEDVPTDYSKTVEQVFQDLVLAMFEKPSTPKYLIVLMTLCHEMLPDVWSYIRNNLSFGRRWIAGPIGPRDYARAMKACRPDIPVYIDMSRTRSVYSIWRGNKDIHWDLIMRHV